MTGEQLDIDIPLSDKIPDREVSVAGRIAQYYDAMPTPVAQ